MTTANLTKKDRALLQDLADRSVTKEGITKEEQEVLNHARAAGDVGEESMPDTAMKFIRQNPLLPQVGTEMAGEELGRRGGEALFNLLNPVKKGKLAVEGVKQGVSLAQKGAQGLGSLLGIAGGDQTGQVITNNPGQEIDNSQTGRAVGFGAAGLGVGSVLNKFLGRRRGELPPEKFEGGKVGQLTDPVMKRANERLVKAGVASRLSNVIKNELIELIDGISSSIPFARKKMENLQSNIQGFYEDRATAFASLSVEKMPKIHLAKLTRDMVVNAQDLASRESMRNYRELDNLVEGGVDLSFMNKGSNVSFDQASKFLLKGSKNNIAIVRKQMKKAITEHNARIVDELKLNTEAGAKAAKNLSGTSLDTPSNRAYLKEFFKTGGNVTEASSNLIERVDNAILFSKKNINMLGETFVKKVANKQPASFLDAFVKPNDPDSLRLAMSMLDEPARQKVRHYFIGGVDPSNKGGILNQATKFADSGGVGELDGKLLINAIKQFEDGFGASMSMALFPGKGLEGLKQLGEELVGFQAKAGSKQGSTAAFLLLPSAISGVAQAIAEGSILSGMSVALATSVGLLTIPIYYANKFNDVNFVKKMTGMLPKRGESAQANVKRVSLFISQLAAQGIEAEFLPHEDVFEPISGDGKHQLTQ